MYGEEKKWRYLIGFGVVIVLLFIIIFMIVKAGNSPDNGKVPETKRELISYADNSNITLTSTTIGPIVAPEQHSELDISISSSQATINIVQGYDGNVVSSQSYPMTTEAFREFLSALDKAGYTNGNTDEALANDEGYCATGQRYIFEIRDGANQIQRFWTTSCSGTKTFRGDRNAVLNLFQSQIPNYGDVTGNANLGSGGLFR